MLPILLALASLVFVVLFGLFGASIWGEIDAPAGPSSGSDFGRVMAAPSAGKGAPRGGGRGTVRIVMQVVISLIILGAAFYMILFAGYDGDHQKWAYGSIGTVVGFWFKG